MPFNSLLWLVEHVSQRGVNCTGRAVGYEITMGVLLLTPFTVTVTVTTPALFIVTTPQAFTDATYDLGPYVGLVQCSERTSKTGESQRLMR